MTVNSEEKNISQSAIKQTNEHTEKPAAVAWSSKQHWSLQPRGIYPWCPGVSQVALAWRVVSISDKVTKLLETFKTTEHYGKTRATYAPTSPSRHLCHRLANVYVTKEEYYLQTPWQSRWECLGIYFWMTRVRSAPASEDSSGSSSSFAQEAGMHLPSPLGSVSLLPESSSLHWHGSPCLWHAPVPKKKIANVTFPQTTVTSWSLKMSMWMCSLWVLK